MTACLTCQTAELAESNGTAADVIRVQAGQVDRLTSRLIDAALEVSRLRQQVYDLEQTAARRNRRLGELARQLERSKR